MLHSLYTCFLGVMISKYYYQYMDLLVNMVFARAFADAYVP